MAIFCSQKVTNKSLVKTEVFRCSTLGYPRFLNVAEGRPLLWLRVMASIWCL